MTTQPAAPELIELERAPTGIEDVLAGLLRNTVGGLAIGGLVWVALTMTPLDWPTVNGWAGRATLAGVSIALIIYGLGDDLWNFWHRRELAAAVADAYEVIDDLEDDLNIARQQRDEAQAEAQRLRAQVRGLMSNRNYVDSAPPADDPTLEDARTLVRLYYQNDAHPARQYMAQHYGWSERRYPRALELLRLAGVVAMKGTKPQWTQPDAASALARLVSPDKPYLKSGDAVSPVATSQD